MFLGTQQVRVCSHGLRVEGTPEPGQTVYVHVPGRPGMGRDYCYDPPSTHQVITATLNA